MTNLEFILKDLESGDFDNFEINIIKKAIKKKKYSEILNSEYSNYDIIDSFYQEV